MSFGWFWKSPPEDYSFEWEDYPDWRGVDWDGEDEDWDEQIRMLWETINKLFTVWRDFKCGTHVHVAPFKRRYSMDDLQSIAYAVASQEEFVTKILPKERRNHQYCQANSQSSTDLSSDLESDREDDPTGLSFRNVGQEIMRKNTPSALRDYVHGDGRYHRWNFGNIVGDKASGTIEFRGGRHVRGEVRTKRWIAFAVSFIAKALKDRVSPCPER